MKKDYIPIPSPGNLDLAIQGKDSKVTLDNLEREKILSKAKIDIIRHQARTKTVLGAKGTGKTILGVCDTLVRMENEPYFNAYAFRKYKESATDKLGSYFNNAIKMIEDYGLKFDFKFKQSRNKFFRLFHKSNMSENQLIEFASLDNPNSTDGAMPANGGYYGVELFDEPIVKDDVNNPDKIPSLEQWEEDLEIINDNLSRSRISFKERVNRNKSVAHKKDYKYTRYFFANNWGEHPIVIHADIFFPLEEFINYTFGSDPMEWDKEYVEKWFSSQDNINLLVSHNTMYKYDEKNDNLIVRMTKFANPNNLTEEIFSPLVDSVKTAIISKDYNKLALLMGWKHQGEAPKGSMLVYPRIEDKNLSTLEELSNDGYKIQALSYGVDIDISRVLTIVPTMLYEKKDVLSGTTDHKIFIGQCIDIKAQGAGAIGSNLALYSKLISHQLKAYFDLIPNNNNDKFNLIKNGNIVVSVDDNKKFMLRDLHQNEDNYWISNWVSPTKQGDIFNIIQRQNTFISGITKGVILMDKSNKNLIVDLHNCVKQDINSTKRKTTSSTNYLDRIDAMEYSLEHFVGTIWKYTKNIV